MVNEFGALVDTLIENYRRNKRKYIDSLSILSNWRAVVPMWDSDYSPINIRGKNYNSIGIELFNTTLAGLLLGMFDFVPYDETSTKMGEGEIFIEGVGKRKVQSVVSDKFGCVVLYIQVKCSMDYRIIKKEIGMFKSLETALRLKDSFPCDINTDNVYKIKGYPYSYFTKVKCSYSEHQSMGFYRKWKSSEKSDMNTIDMVAGINVYSKIKYLGEKDGKHEYVFVSSRGALVQVVSNLLMGVIEAKIN